MRSVPSPDVRRKFGFADTFQAFLMQEGLPFSSLLSAHTVSKIMARYCEPFGEIYTHAIVLWAFLSQVLRDGKEASCQSAVARIISHLVARGQAAPTSDSGDYCKARAKLPEEGIRELCLDVAVQAECQAPDKWLWNGRHAKLVDGFTFLMPDTEKNQAAYPQHVAQKPGIGFPIARVTSIISLVTGCVLAAAIGPYAGKETGETALLRRLIHYLRKGEVLVADRFFCNYWLVASLMSLGIDVCFRQVVSRQGTFKKGKRFGRDDHELIWYRPHRSAWMSQEFYESLPERIVVRRLRYVVNTAGREQKPFVIITTLTQARGPAAVSYESVAELYSFRWNAELDIRNIKTFLNLNHVRCKSPDMVHRELWTTLLAYNLIRVTIATSASLHNRKPRELSFVSACQFVLAAWQELPTMQDAQTRIDYCSIMLTRLSECVVGQRPGRIEPRVLKKRKDQYRLMTQPRLELRRRLNAGDNSFEN